LPQRIGEPNYAAFTIDKTFRDAAKSRVTQQPVGIIRDAA